MEAIRERDPVAARRAVFAEILNGERALFGRDVKEHDEEILGGARETKGQGAHDSQVDFLVAVTRGLPSDFVGSMRNHAPTPRYSTSTAK